jgi:RimJ/RimL family protein N-acetyltransferase
MSVNEASDNYAARWRRKYRIELDTPRFRLRPLAEGDQEWLALIWGDREVNRFLWDPSLTPVKARAAAEAMVRIDASYSHFGHWAIEDKATGECHGWAELGKLRPWWGPNDEIGLSYVLRRESWGRGIATEAARRLLQCAFELHGLECVLAIVTEGHKKSVRVLEKLGMRFIKRATLHDGKRVEYFQIDAPAAD